MPEAIPQPPKTLLEVYRMLPEGTLAELINGTLYMSPAPSLDHQRIILRLAGLMQNHAEANKLGEIFVSPIDVFLDQKNAFQPDIVFVANDNNSILKEDGIYGAPDLVIEVLSPGTQKTDLTTKKAVYEKNGVKEYWVVDPKTRKVIGFKRVRNKFETVKPEKGKLNSALLGQIFKF